MFSKKVRGLFIVFLCFLVVICIVLFIHLYQNSSRKVLDLGIEDIKIEKLDSYINEAMTKEKKKEVNDNPQDYLIVSYKLKISNNSNIIRAVNLNIQPEFFGDMKNIVFWFDYSDALTDNIYVNPSFTGKYGRMVIVKRKGLADEEIIKMAKSVRFKLTYWTYEYKSRFGLLTYGYNSQIFDYKEK